MTKAQKKELAQRESELRAEIFDEYKARINRGDFEGLSTKEVTRMIEARVKSALAKL